MKPLTLSLINQLEKKGFSVDPGLSGKTKEVNFLLKSRLTSGWELLYRMVELNRKSNTLLAVYDQRDRSDLHCPKRKYLPMAKELDALYALLQSKYNSVMNGGDIA